MPDPADAWWAERQDEMVAQDYLDRLEVDLRQRTGNLRLINDPGLRAALVDYYDTWALEQGRIAARRSNLPAMIFRLLPIEFTVADPPAQIVDENRALDMRQLGELELTSTDEVIQSAEFVRELQHELNYTDFVRAALTRLHGNALQLLQLLEASNQ